MANVYRSSRVVCFCRLNFLWWCSSLTAEGFSPPCCCCVRKRIVVSKDQRTDKLSNENEKCTSTDKFHFSLLRKLRDVRKTNTIQTNSSVKFNHNVNSSIGNERHTTKYIKSFFLHFDLLQVTNFRWVKPEIKTYHKIYGSMFMNFGHVNHDRNRKKGKPNS